MEKIVTEEKPVENGAVPVPSLRDLPYAQRQAQCLAMFDQIADNLGLRWRPVCLRSRWGDIMADIQFEDMTTVEMKPVPLELDTQSK